MALSSRAEGLSPQSHNQANGSHCAFFILRRPQRSNEKFSWLATCERNSNQTKPACDARMRRWRKIKIQSKASAKRVNATFCAFHRRLPFVIKGSELASAHSLPTPRLLTSRERERKRSRLRGKRSERALTFSLLCRLKTSAEFVLRAFRYELISFEEAKKEFVLPRGNVLSLNKFCDPFLSLSLLSL
jgi:hypothetical protein